MTCRADVRGARTPAASCGFYPCGALRPARAEGETAVILDCVLLVALALVALNAAPAATFWLLEPRHRAAWPPRARAVSVAPSPRVPYRAGLAAHAPAPGRAPRLVRAVAYCCFALGQLCAPFLVLALRGGVPRVLVFVLLPWAMLAAQNFRAGVVLLRRDPSAVPFTRAVARWSCGLNVALLAAVAGALLLALLDLPLCPLPQLVFGITALTAYAVLSIAHAELLEAAADRLERVTPAPPAPR